MPSFERKKKKKKKKEIQIDFIRAYFKKYALLNLLTLSVLPSVRPSVAVPYYFAIFQPTIFKFWILREAYLSTRSAAGFLDPKPRSSGIELR
jgi:hypothetical protein